MSIHAIHSLVQESPEQVREVLAMYDRRRKKTLRIDCSADVVTHVSKKVRTSLQEYFLVICLDNQNTPLKTLEIHKGGCDAVVIDARCVFRAALAVKGCTRIVLVHNHPTGDLTPSPQDRAVTTKLVKGGDLLGLTVLDHVILSGEDSLSMRDLGMIG